MDSLLLTVSLATACATTLLGGALGAVWLSARRGRRVLLESAARIESQLERLREDLQGVAATQQPLDARVASLTAWVERERLLGSSQLGAPQRAYDLAARMAANGAGRDELVASCGLTAVEADLALLVHRSRGHGRTAA